jgi:peptide/nickel transport system substrate-binding protein
MTRAAEDNEAMGGRPDAIPRRQFLQTAAAGVAVAGSAGILAACSSSTATTTSSAKTVRRGGTLIAGITGGSTVETMNPYGAIRNIGVFGVYENLTAFDNNAHVQPLLAEDLTPNSNATSWTMRIRRGVTFHNGQELTAVDVIASLRRILNPTSPGASSVASIDAAGLRQLDKYTVQIPCKTPFSTLPETLTGVYFLITPDQFDPNKPNGTGPFKFKSATPGVQCTLLRNENYWQTGIPYLDKLVFSEFADETSQVNALLSGTVGLVNSLSYPSLKTIKGAGDTAWIVNGGLWTPFYMRVDQPPFNDVRVRQAMRLIPDRPQMLELIFGDLGIVANDLFSVFDPDYDSGLPQRHQDLDQAKFLLKQAGQENLSVQLVTADVAEGTLECAQVLKQQALGAGVNISLNEVTVSEMYGPKFLSWTFAQDFWGFYDYLPQVAMATLDTAPFNECHFDNTRYNSLYGQALATTDPAKVKTIVQDMQEIDYNSGGYIIPYFCPNIDASLKTVHGVQESKVGRPFGNYNYRTFWVE